MKKHKSLYFKVLIILLVIMISIDIASYILMTQRTEVQISERITEDAFLVLHSLDWALSPLLETEEFDTIQRLIENVATYSLVNEVKIIDGDANTLFANRELVSKDEDDVIVKAIFIEQKRQHVLRTIKDNILIYAIPIHGGEFIENGELDIQTALVLTVDTQYEKKLIAQLRNSYIRISVMTTGIVILIVGIIIYYFVATPLKKFEFVVERLSKRDYSQKVEIHSEGEFKNLSLAFNNMIDEFKTHTDELHQARAVAEGASQAKIEFLANVSHELRTPLNSIIGFTDLIEQEEMDDNKKRKLNTIQKAGKHLLMIINDILDISIFELDGLMLEGAPFSLRELIDELANLYKPLIEAKNLDFVVEISKNVPQYLNGDAHRCSQIISNLISNAIKFTERGSILVKVDYETSNLYIQVTDTGIGIDEKKFATIFDAFSQSDPSDADEFGGTGLGLAICKKIAETMGGELSIKSEVGIGSTFKVKLHLESSEIEKDAIESMIDRWIYSDNDISDLVISVIKELPESVESMNIAIQTNKVDVLKELSHSLKGITGTFHMHEIYIIFRELDEYLGVYQRIDEKVEEVFKKINTIVQKIPYKYLESDSTTNTEENGVEPKLVILIAEDVEENQDFIKQILANYSVKIETAKNGLEVLEKLFSKTYDVLLLDIQMPVMNGTEVLLWISENKKMISPYIIAVTTNARQEDIDKYMSHGCDWFISKPIDKNILKEKIQELIDHKIKLSTNEEKN